MDEVHLQTVDQGSAICQYRGWEVEEIERGNGVTDNPVENERKRDNISNYIFC